MTEYMLDKHESTNTNKYLFYMHAGSGNHGCEAIVRSLCRVLQGKSDISLLSYKPDEDHKYGLNNICDIKRVEHPEAKLITKVWYYGLRKLSGKADAQMKSAFRNARPLNQYESAISIGGDNYCYDNMLFDLAGSNAMFTRNGIKTALVGCSIEPELLQNPDIIKDMMNYRVIVARETRTFEALTLALGVDSDGICEKSGTRIYLAPDPAFVLDAKECVLPENFKPQKTIGINVSPMILSYERPDAPGITLKNYANLILHILEKTDYSVALIPHVVTPGSDDREAIRLLRDMLTKRISDNADVDSSHAKDYASRIIIVEDHPAEELKYIISQCHALITARTHASIAAYSTLVPTLVVGYSVKAMGIAKDLFGTTDGYVCPVQELVSDSDLVDAFIQLEEAADIQRDILSKRIPKIKEEVFNIKYLIQDDKD